MFGPGLEQSTSGLVRKMLYEDNEMFKRVAMFPGQFDGEIWCAFLPELTY